MNYFEFLPCHITVYDLNGSKRMKLRGTEHLKVDGNEKIRGGQPGQGGHSNSGSVWHCGDRGLL